MNNLGLCFVVQLGLALGSGGTIVAGQVHAALRSLDVPFRWQAVVRFGRNGIAAIGLSLLLLVTRLAGYR
jgi:hypothetical protein